MDNPLDELAELVGRVLADRWLARNATSEQTESQEVPDSQRPDGSPTEHSVDQSDAEATSENDSDESSKQ